MGRRTALRAGISVLATLLALLATPAPASADDPPTVFATSVTPSSLPVEGGQVTVETSATDDGSVVEVYAVARGTDGTDVRIPMPPSAAGRWAGTGTLPGNQQYDVPLTFHVFVHAVDDAGHDVAKKAKDVTLPPRPDQLPVITAVTADPVFLPGTGGPVTVGATVTDDRGLASVKVGAVTLQRVAGTRYEATVQVPPNRTADPATTTLAVLAVEADGAQRTVSAPTPLLQLGPGDVEPITVSGVAATPASVPASGDDVTVTATIAGAAGVETARVSIATGDRPVTGSMTRTSSSSDVWTGTVAVPANPGTSSRTAAISIRADGFDGGAVQPTVATVTQAGDPGADRPPVVTRISASPRAAAGQTDVTVGAVVTDDHGVGTVTADTYGPVDVPSATLHHVAGDYYEGQLELPFPFDEPWGDIRVTAVDGAGGTTTADGGPLESTNAGSSTTITDIDVSPTAIGYAGGVVAVSATLRNPSVGVYRAGLSLYLDGGGELRGRFVRVAAGSDRFSGRVYLPPNLTGGALTHDLVVRATANDDVAVEAHAGPLVQPAAPADPALPVVSAVRVGGAPVLSSGGWVTVSATVTGATGIAETTATLAGPDGIIVRVPMARTTGDRFVGGYRVSPTPSTLAVAWELHVTARDTAGRIGVAVAAPFLVEAGSGSRPPLSSWTTSPAAVPASGGPVGLHVTYVGGSTISALYLEVSGPGGRNVRVLMKPRGTGRSEWNTSVDFRAIAAGTSGAHHLEVLAVYGDQYVRRALGTLVQGGPAPVVSGASVSATSVPASGGRVQVRTDATDERPLAEVFARVRGPQGYRARIALPQRAAGDWTISVPLPANTTARPARYQVSVVALDDTRQATELPAGTVTVAVG